MGLSPVVHFRLGRRRWLRDERAINVCNEKDGARGSENAACARGVPSVAAPLGRRASLIRARSSACSMRRPGAGAVVRLLSSPSFAWRNRISIAAKELGRRYGAGVWILLRRGTLTRVKAQSSQDPSAPVGKSCARGLLLPGLEIESEMVTAFKRASPKATTVTGSGATVETTMALPRGSDARRAAATESPY